MTNPIFSRLTQAMGALHKTRDVGRVSALEGNMLYVRGLSETARIGDQVALESAGETVLGEVVRIEDKFVSILPEKPPLGIGLGDPVRHIGPLRTAPSDLWIGRAIDPNGRPLDGKPLLPGSQEAGPSQAPPMPTLRRALGPRLSTGMTVFNTLLPIVRGQRIGLFSGSGVGKSSLLGHLAQHMQADIVVLALIGERGRELGEFISHTLGEAGMRRSVVIAATSDQSPLLRRRCATTAMTVAEHFRDQGKHVLFLADSITRFAEAHREVAIAAGETPALRGYPPSTAHRIMALCERAGPGAGEAGDITALFSVLVAGSDMEEPIADILRGVLDGHVVLDRAIAERGRYPAIDLLKSVSRSLPRAAEDHENALIAEARQLLGAYDQSALMIRAGLYAQGSDPELDRAIRAWPDLDAFLAQQEVGEVSDSFAKLALILRRSRASSRPEGPVSSKEGASPGEGRLSA